MSALSEHQPPGLANDSFATNSRVAFWGAALALAVVTLAIYWPVTRSEFVNIDDWEYVTDNPHIKHGLVWEDVLWAFRKPLAGNWHPLTSLSHMLDCSMFGLEPWGHHLTNLLFHVANTLLLFGVLKKMTCAFWCSAFVAALFALHPLHVESVAWVSERKDVLSAFFFMLTLWAYVCYAEFKTQNAKRKTATYLLALLFFALGLMSKPMLVTMPFVLLLLDFWPLQRFTIPSRAEAAQRQNDSPFTVWQLVREKLPFFLLAATASAVALLTQKNAGAVVALEKFSFGGRLANAVVSYARYLGKTIWPDSLAVFYPYEGGWPAWQVVGSVVLLAVMSLTAIWLARRQPYWSVGWFWFAGMLVPVIGLVQIGSQAMADRYTYLPHIGIFLLVTYGLSEFLVPRANRRIVATGIAAIVLIGCAAVSSLQVRHWKNSEALMGHAVQVTSRNPRAHYCLGIIFEKQGRTNDAIAHYTEAVRELPECVEAHCALGSVWAAQNELEKAALEFQTALRWQPQLAQAHYGFAEVLTKRGQVGDAMTHYSTALQSEPEFAPAHYQLATLLSEKKQTAEAIAHYREAVRLKPDWIEALNNLAWILATHADARFRNGGEATRLAARAVELTSTNNAGALDTLAAAYAETGRFADAINTAEKAVRAAVNQEALIAEIRKRLELYRGGRVFHE